LIQLVFNCQLLDYPSLVRLLARGIDELGDRRRIQNAAVGRGASVGYDWQGIGHHLCCRKELVLDRHGYVRGSHHLLGGWGPIGAVCAVCCV